MGEQQVKSKQRVADHGEVFTAEREVNAMLDLVKAETERVDSRFLEPACGDGNFLAEILRRKLRAAERAARIPGRKTPDPAAYELNAVIAASGIYGVDILRDNVEACRERMFGIWSESYFRLCRDTCDSRCAEAVRFILDRNIICGNALTLCRVDEAGRDTEEPIIFSEWAFTGRLVKRRDFRFDALLKAHEETPSLDMAGWEYDYEAQAFIPGPVRDDFPIVDYTEVQNAV